MECKLIVPHKTDISVIEKAYPDIYNDDIDEEGDVYCIGDIDESDGGDDDEDAEGDKWLDYEEAIEFCGFAEGAIEEAEAVIEGNGTWAMSMIRRTDFSSYENRPELPEYQRRSAIWQEAFARGKAARLAVT